MKTSLWLPAGQSPPCFKAFELKKPPNKALILRSNSFSLKLLYHYLPSQGLYWSSLIYFFLRITGVDKISLSPYFGMDYLPISHYKSNKHSIWRIYNGLESYLWETAACCSTPFMKHLAWRGKVLLQCLLLIRSRHGLWFWFQRSSVLCALANSWLLHCKPTWKVMAMQWCSHGWGYNSMSECC